MGNLQLETAVVDRLTSSQYYNFALLAYADMLQMGQADPGRGWPVTQDTAAVVAKIGDLVVGIATFGPTDPECASVGFAYVLPDYRRRGIFGHAYAELVRWCEREGRRMIEFEVPISNSAFGRILVSTGASVVAQCFRVEI